MFSNEAEEVKFIIDFVTFKIIRLNVIVTNNAIASLFPILVLFIEKILSMKKYSYILFTNM